MGYSREEMETSLVFDAVDNEWKGYSCYPSHVTKIIKLLGLENIKAEFEEGRESPVSIRFTLKPKQVSFRQESKRQMSEEQKQMAAERLAKARAKK